MSTATTAAGVKVRLPVFDAALVGATVLLFFGHTWFQLIELWNKDANYSHGYAIPFLAAIPAWLYVKRTGIPALGEPILGTMYLLSGGITHLLAQVFVWPPLDFIALVLVLRGSAVAVGGSAWANAFNFPILFLFFMFPLPVTWTGYMALWLQDIVSRASAIVLDPFLTCYRKGNALYLAGIAQPLVVAEECSGLRQIIAFFAAGAYYAYFSGRPTVYRVLLVLVAVPVAIAANVLRIVLMAFGAKYFGTDWLSSSLHYAPALFSIPIGIGLYALVGWGLGRFWPATREGGGA